MKNVRRYGEAPYTLALVHGGPGAPGEMAPVAREMAASCGVLEPLQTEATLEGQIEELKTVLEENGALPLTLIGHSWGAMLAFIVTAMFPALVKKLILVGSGAFEEKYAVSIDIARLSRLTEKQRTEIFKISEALENPATTDKDRLMGKLGTLFFKADSFAPISFDSEVIEVQYEVNKNVWKQAKELRISGKLLEMGSKIECPVLAIHGDYDPHLPEGIEEPLKRVLKDFRFVLLPRCGHYPWLERNARGRFYDILKHEI
jgi:pimeloyl-ACP methyl ester carboxylesterase